MDVQLAKRLFDAQQAALKIEAITREKTFADYESTEIMRLAVERLLEIIGEALTVALRLDPELQIRFPDLRRSVGLRNRIIHGYDDINDLVIWDIVQNNLPSLVDQLGTLLADEPDGESS